MGAQAAVQPGDLLLQGHWGKEYVAGQCANFNTLYIRTIKRSPNQKRKDDKKKKRKEKKGKKVMAQNTHNALSYI